MSKKQTPNTEPKLVGITKKLPEDFSIRVLIHGLLVGCFNSDGHFEVGVFNESPDHEFNLSVWEKAKGKNGKDQKIFSSDKAKSLNKDSEIHLKVYRPRKGFEQVNRFEVGKDFDRFDPKANRNDFRWIVNFEASDLHAGQVRKRGDKLHPRFYLENGTVFTFIRSVPLLKERREDGQKRILILGRIASVTAAHIYLAPGQASKPAAELIIAGKKISFSPGTQYDVVLRNDCPGNTHALAARNIVDTTQLNETFTPPSRQAHFTLYPGIEGISAGKMMDEEVRGLDLGELAPFFASPSYQGNSLGARKDRIIPCGAAFFGSGSLD